MAALPDGLEEADAGGDGDVEAGDLAEHRDAEQEVAGLGGQVTDAVAFGAEHDRQRAGLLGQVLVDQRPVVAPQLGLVLDHRVRILGIGEDSLARERAVLVGTNDLECLCPAEQLANSFQPLIGIEEVHQRLSLNWFAAGLLLLASAALALATGPAFAALLALYFAFTLAYSLRLKRAATVDVMTLAGLYTLRIVAGGAAAGVPVSFWLLAFSMFLFFSLAVVKRYTELDYLREAGIAQSEGRGYYAQDLSMMAMFGGASLVALLPCFWIWIQLPGLLGVIFSAIGMRATKHQQRRGRGLAIAGLVVGLIAVAIAVLFTLYVYTSDNCTTTDFQFECNFD